MDTIKNYLEGMFQALPKTEEALRLKSELLYNMEQKYQELKEEGKTENEAIGKVISEFGNIDELLSEMEIDVSNSKDTLRAVSLEEAQEFITYKHKASYLIGLGAALIILGTSFLVFLTQLVKDQLVFQTLSSNAQEALPVIFLFLFIVPAVGMFIYSGNKLDRFKYINEGQFELSSTTKSILDRDFAAFSPKQTIGIIIGVCLCVLSPIAVLIGSMISESASTYGASVLLIIIAIAVFIFVHYTLYFFEY
jgi:TRAP-type mannitol/chloroaromatic compound transport system permease small subunit